MTMNWNSGLASSASEIVNRRRSERVEKTYFYSSERYDRRSSHPEQHPPRRGRRMAKDDIYSDDPNLASREIARETYEWMAKSRARAAIVFSPPES